MSFLDDLRADLKAMQQRLDAEDQFPEYVMITPDLKKFKEYFEAVKGKPFADRCDGYRVIEHEHAKWPFLVVPAKMLEAPKTLMEKKT